MSCSGSIGSPAKNTLCTSGVTAASKARPKSMPGSLFALGSSVMRITSCVLKPYGSFSSID